MTDNAIVPAERLRSIMRSPEILERFAEVLGQHNAPAYVSSVLLAVANNDQLQSCSPQSIITSAMRAATLRLSCDPSTKQAHLVPFKGRATLVVGHKGYYDMAQRTGRYRYLNDFKVWDGQEVVEDQLRGTIEIRGARKPGGEVIGYGFYFEMVNGLKKVFYMTVAEIQEHGAKHSKTYSFANSLWKTNFDAMARKTVIRLCLSRYGYLDPSDALTLNAVDETDGEDLTLPEPAPDSRKAQSERQILNSLGFESEPEDDITPGEWRDAEEPAPIKPWTSQAVTLEMAQSEKSSDGSLYWEMPTDQLSIRVNSISKSLEKNHLEDAKRNEMMLKRDVCRAIIEYRTT